jgi:DNA polymerase-3 subunit gamma/tau
MYRVLARKYRPQTFDDLIGQEVLVRTLTNAFASGRIAHAWVLTGIRGIGKTTTARIIARGLNCIGPDGNGEPTTQPCGVCPNCVMIAEDRHVDVIEMDAASNTGVDNMRDLIDSVQYAPTNARYKVYIIDEVHMLSKSAFNAILKTLEEPPPHVKFIFATTELRKIPITIISRCQKFDLKRIEIAELAKHLIRVSSKESIQLAEDCATLIAAAAEGSVRDALSLLDQAIAMGTDASGNVAISAELIRDMLGLADKTQLFTLLKLIFSGNMEGALAQAKTLHAQGADPAMLLTDLLDIIHYLTRITVASPLAENLHYSPAEQAMARAMVGELSIPMLTRAWQITTKGIDEMRHTVNALATLEMILVRLGYASQLPTPAEIIRGGAVSESSLRPRVEPEGGTRPSSAASSATALPHLASPASGGGVGSVHPMPSTTMQRADHRIIGSSDHRITATAAKIEPKPVVELHSFLEVVELFEARREAMLAKFLINDMRLVAFERGRIEIKPAGYIPSDVPARLGRLLSEWTGARWSVVYNEQAAGEPTLREQRASALAQQKQYAIAHPKVQAALALFPDAEIEFIPNKKP